MGEHYTEEGTGLVPAGPDEIEEARKRHHLATADPDLEGTMTGPAHEKKYGLEREEASAEALRAVGVHPYENGALDEPQTADAKAGNEKAAAPRASDNK